MKIIKKFITVIVLFLVLSSCSEYQKAFKSENAAEKYKTGAKMYELKKFDNALRLFEQISNSFMGNPESEGMYYMYAQSLFKTKEYKSAGYQFTRFVSNFPKSDKAEECFYLSALCYAKLSPVFSVDQNETDTAIEKFQSFIDVYPTSVYLTEANQTVKLLREKIEKKAFEIAKLYNDISDYKSAITAFNSFIIDFPGTPYKEEALFYKFEATFNFAVNSVPAKKQDRLHDAQLAHAALFKFKANSEFKDKANSMMAKVEQELKQFSK